jgi:hypothetical protein
MAIDRLLKEILHLKKVQQVAQLPAAAGKVLPR